MSCNVITNYLETELRVHQYISVYVDILTFFEPENNNEWEFDIPKRKA